jgi:alpha-galactosidase
MLEVGNGGMTIEEYKSHFSLWAMMAAPLMAGNDVRSMTGEIREILLNPEVIAVDQDSLGAQGRIVIDRGYGGQVWMKPLADGSRAVALLNLSSEEQELYVRWSSIDLPPGSAEVRDLWTRRSLGLHRDEGKRFDERFRAKVPPHGVVMLRIRSSN